MKQQDLKAALESWDALNAALREADEATCESLQQAELKGAARPTFVRRIHSRLNKARADRERAELEAKVAKPS